VIELDVNTRIEEHLQSLQGLVNDVKDIGRAVLCSNRRIPSANYNNAFRVSVTEADVDKLIAEVVKYYRSMQLRPCFMVSPKTSPPTFAESLIKAGFKPTLAENAMVYEGKNRDFKLDPDVKIVVNDGSLLDVWTNVMMKSIKVPTVLRGALIEMFGKASKRARSYLCVFDRCEMWVVEFVQNYS
jgi:hypothetical protein